jgi:hypothetical protein
MGRCRVTEYPRRPMPANQPRVLEMDNEQLETTIKALIDRRNEVIEGSAEYEQIVFELGCLFESHEDAQLIAEEYKSLLGIIDNDEQELENMIRH